MNLPLPWDSPAPWFCYGALISLIGVCGILLGRNGEEWRRTSQVLLLAAGSGLMTPIMTYLAFHFLVDPDYVLLHDKNFVERFSHAISLPLAPMVAGLLSISVVFIAAFIICSSGKPKWRAIYDTK